MGQEFPLNDPLARQVWSNELSIEAPNEMFWKAYMGTDANSVIKVEEDLKKTSAGEKITTTMQMKLSGDGAEGDNKIEGTSAEEKLNLFPDAVYIDQRRKSVESPGKMELQRVPMKMRKAARDALAIWNGEDADQMLFCYLSGARGVNDFHFPSTWTGRANNTLQTPTYTVYGDDAGTPATSKADLAVGDIMTLNTIERAKAVAKTVNPKIRPITRGNRGKYLMVMHIFQAFSLRNSTSDRDWRFIRSQTDGKDSLIYKDALGEWGGVILQEHENVIQFNDYGAVGNVNAARALLLGAHAGMMAWGKGSAWGKYDWNEETEDRGNVLVVTSAVMRGEKKTRYNSKDIGVIAVDTAYTNPLG